MNEIMAQKWIGLIPFLFCQFHQKVMRMKSHAFSSFFLLHSFQVRGHVNQTYFLPSQDLAVRSAL
jgi:hypothetical protein